MSFERFRGTGVAVVTPFCTDFSVDYHALELLIEDLIKNKVDYLVILGTTAESVVLTQDEKNRVIETVVRVNNGRLPIVLGMGGNNTQSIIDQMKTINNDGIDAYLSVTPYYNKPSQEGLYQHYTAIAKVSKLPIMLYNVPGRTGVNMKAEITLRLAKENKNIIAIKEASGDFIQMMDLLKYRPKNFLVISGDDAITFPLVTLGGDGVISVIANAFPKEFSQMVRDVLNGDLEKSRVIHYRFTDIIKYLFIEGNPAGIKALLNIKGLTENVLRLPLCPVSTPTYLQLKEQMNEIASLQ